MRSAARSEHCADDTGVALGAIMQSSERCGNHDHSDPLFTASSHLIRRADQLKTTSLKETAAF